MIGKFKRIIDCIIGIPKTIFFNFKVFKFKVAIKLPIFISNNVRIFEIYKNCININSKVSPFMIRIGIGGSPAINEEKGLIFLNKKKGGKLIFNGKANLAYGIKIYNNSGTIEFGKGFSANKNCFLSCDEKITFGNDVLLGWNINIRDSDGHTIWTDEKENKDKKEIAIGNHVWICSYVDILKGTIIKDESVIAYRSCITGKKFESNSLIGGYPAKILKSNIRWKK